MELDDNYLVYTNYDREKPISKASYILLWHHRLLVISDGKVPEYTQGEGAEQILAAYTDNMEARGYESSS